MQKSSYIRPRTFDLFLAGSTFITFPESDHFWSLRATTLAQATIIPDVIYSNIVLTHLCFYSYSPQSLFLMSKQSHPFKIRYSMSLLCKIQQWLPISPRAARFQQKLSWIHLLGLPPHYLWPYLSFHLTHSPNTNVCVHVKHVPALGPCSSCPCCLKHTSTWQIPATPSNHYSNATFLSRPIFNTNLPPSCVPYLCLLSQYPLLWSFPFSIAPYHILTY